jgi:hypothetical protein
MCVSGEAPHCNLITQDHVGCCNDDCVTRACRYSPIGVLASVPVAVHSVSDAQGTDCARRVQATKTRHTWRTKQGRRRWTRQQFFSSCAVYPLPLLVVTFSNEQSNRAP